MRSIVRSVLLQKMAAVMSLESVLAARNVLKTSLENSRALSSALNETKPKLAEISMSLPLLEATIKPFASIKDQIKLAVLPAAAALKILDSIRELEKTLVSSSEIFTYVAALRRMEEAIKFLADNCCLASKWLHGVVDSLEERPEVNEAHVSNLKRSLMTMQELPAKAVLCEALDKLERLFEQLLADGGMGLQHPTCSVPQAYLQKVKFVVERLDANGRMSSCKNVFVAIRSEIARRRIEALDLDYLQKPNWDGFLSEWGKDLEFTVKNVLEFEHRLCLQTFTNIGSNVATVCFAEIVSKSGFLLFIQFGMNVAKSKKEASKLLKLLEIFSVLRNLRADFNRLFGNESCSEVQTKTRDLIKEAVNNVAEIFFELPTQVMLQRHSSPPADGSVPKLVSFGTDYCNQLLNEQFKPSLSQILEIRQSWKPEQDQEQVTTDEIIYCIIREIALNLDSWSKSYEDRVLSYIFMMNNHSHFFNLKGTQLGALMGETWVSSNGRYREYYLALYLRESWGNLPAMLSQQSPSLARLKAFKEAFNRMYKRQENWVVCDEDLRQKVRELVFHLLVPVYESSYRLYEHLLRHEEDYCVHRMQSMLGALFQTRDESRKSIKESHFTEKVRSAFSTQMRLTLKAM